MDPEGQARGLALWWTDEVNIEILNTHKYFIHAKYHASVTIEMLCVYGEATAHLRDNAWNLIESYLPEGDIPWVILVI